MNDAAGIQGEQLGNFSPIRLLLEANYDFENRIVAQRNGNILGYFLLKLMEQRALKNVSNCLNTNT